MLYIMFGVQKAKMVGAKQPDIWQLVAPAEPQRFRDMGKERGLTQEQFPAQLGAVSFTDES
jgi:hypothetical protein